MLLALMRCALPPVGATSRGGASDCRCLPPLQMMTGEFGDGRASCKCGETGERGVGAAAFASAVYIVVAFFVVCLFVCLLACLLVCLFVCLFVCLVCTVHMVHDVK